MANEFYISRQTSRTWSDTGADELLNINSLAANDVSGLGSYWDRDTGATGQFSEWFEWRLLINGWAGAGVQIGETVDLYFSQAQGTAANDFDGPPTTAPTDTVAGTLDNTSAAERRQKLPNLQYAGSVTAHTTSQADVVKSSGVIRLTMRYISPVVHNRVTTSALNTSGHIITLTPIPTQYQP